MAPPIVVSNDVISPTGPSYSDITAREANTREAMWILSVWGPLAAAIVSLFASGKWNSEKIWSFSRLVTLWFISIFAMGYELHEEALKTDRSFFVVAVLHNQVEILLNALLLKGSAKQALAAFWLSSIFTFGATLFAPDIRVVYIIVSVMGGTCDILMTSLLVYAKQWGFAMGAFAHMVWIVMVYVEIVHNVGIILYTAVTFFALWAHIFFTIAGVFNSPRGIKGEGPANPLEKAKIPGFHLFLLIAGSFGGSTIITLLLAYMAPKLK